MFLKKEKLFINRFSNNSGQAILLVVLVMIVGLTVGLSVVSRSIVSIKTSTEEADSQKALAAAEAGIEKALNTNASIGSSDTSLNYQVSINEIKGIDSFLVNGGNIILQGDGADIWLVNHEDNVPDYGGSSWTGTVNLYWGTSSTACSNPALEVVVLSGPKASPVLKRYAFDSCSDRASENGFSLVGQEAHTIQGVNFYYKKAISISSGFFVRVIPVYMSSVIGADGGGSSLPSQGFSVSSTGISGTGESQVKRTIESPKTYEAMPVYFLTYGLFSP